MPVRAGTSMLIFALRYCRSGRVENVGSLRTSFVNLLLAEPKP